MLEGGPGFVRPPLEPAAAPAALDEQAPRARAFPVRPVEPVPLVSLEGIVKRYPGVVANDGATLVVRPGEVHALAGENGSGKSTLMKVLSGILRPDAGTIRIDGTAVRFGSSLGPFAEPTSF